MEESRTASFHTCRMKFLNLREILLICKFLVQALWVKWRICVFQPLTTRFQSLIFHLSLHKTAFLIDPLSEPGLIMIHGCYWKKWGMEFWDGWSSLSWFLLLLFFKFFYLGLWALQIASERPLQTRSLGFSAGEKILGSCGDNYTARVAFGWEIVSPGWLWSWLFLQLITEEVTVG